MTDARIKPMVKRHAAACARLHQECIHTGKLSSYGERFLKQLYMAIPKCPTGFGEVYEEGDEVLGFVACAESIGRLYRQSLLRRGFFMALPMVRRLVRPRVIKQVIETLRYPSEVSEDLPAAEILSIAVDPESQGKGIGKMLISAGLEEFKRRGIQQVKVAVLEILPSNKFYQRYGFKLVQTVEHHGRATNIYTINVAP